MFPHGAWEPEKSAYKMEFHRIMHENTSLALIVAYYLSKYDRMAYAFLGYSSQKDTHEKIGKILGVKLNYLKNMRDHFDSIHDNSRVGWYQEPLRPRLVRVVELFQDFHEEELREIVIDILKNRGFSKSEEYSHVLTSISKYESEQQERSVFIVRGPTGRKAEEIFIKHHCETGKPFLGILQDMREYGCGFDFELTHEDKKAFIEVKGLDGEVGGVSFTSKEWDVARTVGDSYYLVIVRNVSSLAPSIQFIQNPFSVLLPSKCVYTTLQVRWNVADKMLVSL